MKIHSESGGATAAPAATALCGHSMLCPYDDTDAERGFEHDATGGRLLA